MTNPCKTCGHDMTAHIYHEGACRPGWVCESKCEKFVSGNSPQDEATRLAEEYVTDKESNTVSEWQKNAFLAGRASQDARIAQLESALKLAATRLEILTGRMRGCHEETGKHELLEKAEIFCLEAKEALSTTADRDEGKEEKWEKK